MSAASRRAEASLTVPSALQVAPLLMEYHQAPLAVSAAVTAMPVRAPLSGSVTLSSPPAGEERSTSDATRVPTAPTGVPASSRMGSRVGLRVPSRSGAVFALIRAMASISSPPAERPTLVPRSTMAAVAEDVLSPVAVTVRAKTSKGVTDRLLVPTVSLLLSDTSICPAFISMPPRVMSRWTRSRPEICCLRLMPALPSPSISRLSVPLVAVPVAVGRNRLISLS